MAPQSATLAESLSTVATAVAAIVALAIPFVMDKLTRKREKDEHKKALDEICYSVDQGVLHYLRIRDMVVAPDALRQGARFRQIEVESRALAEALIRMLLRPGLTDGPLVSGSAAIELLQGVSAAAAHAAGGNPGAAQSEIQRYHHVAQLALSRSDKVRDHHHLPRRPQDQTPTF